MKHKSNQNRSTKVLHQRFYIVTRPSRRQIGRGKGAQLPDLEVVWGR